MSAILSSLVIHFPLGILSLTAKMNISLGFCSALASACRRWHVIFLLCYLAALQRVSAMAAVVRLVGRALLQGESVAVSSV